MQKCFGATALALVAGALAAQEPATKPATKPTTKADSASLQSSDTAARRQQRALDSLARTVRSLEDRLDSLIGAGAGRLATAAAPPARAAGSYMNISFDGLTDAGLSTQRTIGALQRGDHDPLVRGFTIPNAELTLDGTVDPYFKGFANIVYKLNAQGETGVELEEMFFLSTSLPANLQLKVGQFFTEFGRQNAQHPHAWSFVDQPLVLNRMFGPDGMRSQGARVSWLAPTSWYTEGSLSVLNSAGGTTHSFRSEQSAEIHGGVPIVREVRQFADMVIVPRLATSIELTGTQTLLVGASAVFGPNNSGPDAATQIYGADLYWKWKSATARQGFPFVSGQAEVLYRRYDAAQRMSVDAPAVTLPAEVLRDWGGYAQLLWGIEPLIVVGLRGDVVRGNAASFVSEARVDRVRLSPNVTWYPSEYSKVRLQYNYDERAGLGTDHSLWLQFEFILGAHAAHKF